MMKLALILFLLLGAPSAWAADSGAKRKVLVVTGGHGFNREAFFKVFKENANIEFTEGKHVTKMADAYDRDDLYTYDAVVLYDMPKDISESQRKRFLGLFERGIGLVALHHSLVSYQHWADYERIIGGRYPEEDGKSGVVTAEVGYEHDVEVPVVIRSPAHPVTAGLSNFKLHDEIYWGFRVGKDVQPLLATTHEKSGKILGWSRTEGRSRVVYLQSGHGPEAFGDPHYRQLVAQSIAWVARDTK